MKLIDIFIRENPINVFFPAQNKIHTRSFIVRASDHLNYFDFHEFVLIYSGNNTLILSLRQRLVKKNKLKHLRDALKYIIYEILGIMPMPRKD